jgi:hypothetical protein
MRPINNLARDRMQNRQPLLPIAGLPTLPRAEEQLPTGLPHCGAKFRKI